MVKRIIVSFGAVPGSITPGAVVRRSATGTGRRSVAAASVFALFFPRTDGHLLFVSFDLLHFYTFFLRRGAARENFKDF
jgi:hypothetical protein